MVLFHIWNIYFIREKKKTSIWIKFNFLFIQMCLFSSGVSLPINTWTFIWDKKQFIFSTDTRL